MFSTPEIVVLLLVAILGHIMALLWYAAYKYDWRLCQRRIYDLPITHDQIRRELKNSLHVPMHAVLLAVLLALGFFQNTSIASFFYSVIGTTIWAEIWHYASHRAFHLRALHWIHVEHHKSRVNSPFTAISFSFTEKLTFDGGLLVVLACVDAFCPLNFFGIATWFVGYLLVNSFGHANFELGAARHTHSLGKVLTSTTYHSLHHSRYSGNYGLSTRILDRMFKTEWNDYEKLYDRINLDRKPLDSLRERVTAS
jgi:Delta7-sterol 5-desaturase